MSNMSYCRFENTVADIRDCLNAIRDAGGIENLMFTRDDRDARCQEIHDSKLPEDVKEREIEKILDMDIASEYELAAMREFADMVILEDHGGY